MIKINLNEFVCHGLSGMHWQNYISENETEKIIRAFDSKFYDELKNLKCDSSIIFGLYRLQQILKKKKIETYSDVLNSSDELIINDGNKLGVYNASNEICFAMPNAEFHKDLPANISLSCDAGGAYGCFIKEAISVMLKYDDEFKEHKKSENLNGIFQDEIRIEGSINNPKIFAVGIPLTNSITSIKTPGKRNEELDNWIRIISFVRNMLNSFGYQTVYIVDSIEGYNLENPEIINIYKQTIAKGEQKRSYTIDTSGHIIEELDFPYSFPGDLKNNIKQR